MFKPLKNQLGFPGIQRFLKICLFLRYALLPEIKPTTRICALAGNQTGDSLVHRTLS